MDATGITAWNALVNSFLSVFTQPSGEIFARLLVGWVLWTGRRTITGMIRGADPEGLHAHDAYHRFVREAAWAMDDLWQRLIVLLVQRFTPVESSGSMWTIPCFIVRAARSRGRVGGATPFARRARRWFTPGGSTWWF